MAARWPALTVRLIPLLRAAGKPGESARIVIIGGAAQSGTIHFDDVNLTANFATLRAVSQFCRANDVFTVELARRLTAAHDAAHVTITCLKIGVVKTNIRREFPLWMKWLVALVFDPLLGQTASQAAESALRLLLAEEFEGVTGALFLKIRKFKQASPGTSPHDPEEASRLWELSERLTAKGQRVSYGFPRSAGKLFSSRGVHGATSLSATNIMDAPKRITLPGQKEM